MTTAVRTPHGHRWKCRRRAFTLIELLIVIGIVALLASLMWPALARAKSRAQAILCMNNTRQLLLACTMYAADNDDRLVYNLGGDRTRRTVPSNLDMNWVNNVMTWELDAGNTNTAFVAKAKLAPYSGWATRIYRCPADDIVSAIQRRAGWSGRVRSISMNAMVGHPGESYRDGRNLNNPDYRQFLKLSAMENPAQIFVFLDEHPDSINDGYFLNAHDDMEWVDLPASYHHGAGSFSFADGHSEIHPWRYPSTKRPARPEAAPLPFAVPINERADFDWIGERTSVER